MNHPSWKPAFFLSLTVFVLGSFTYWLQFSHQPKKERKDAALKRPLAFETDSAQIASFRVSTRSGTLEAKCESLAAKTCNVGSTGEWSITAPEPLKGDAARIRDFLNSAATLSGTETLDLSEESEEKRKRLLEEYGLDEAKRSAADAAFLEITLENGKKHALWFGDRHPIGDRIFVANAENGVLNTNTMFLVADPYRESLLGKNLTHFRDKTIFSFKRADIDAFSAKGSKGAVSGKRVEGLWQINQMEADHDRIDSLLSSISQAEAKEFPAESELRGANPVYSFQGRIGDKPAVEFTLLSKAASKSDMPGAAKTVYLKSPALKVPAVEVESGLLVNLDKSASYLRRNLLILPSQRVTITHLKLEGKNHKPAVEFAYDGKTWNKTSGADGLNAGKVPELLDRMAGAHSPDIVAPAPKIPDDGVTITLGTKEKQDVYRYLVYEVRNQTFAKDLLSKKNEAFLLEDGLKNAFPFRPDSWKMPK